MTLVQIPSVARMGEVLRKHTVFLMIATPATNSIANQKLSKMHERHAKMTMELLSKSAPRKKHFN